MLISLNWIADFVDLPAGLDPRALAERFTRTTAEVDGVHRVEIGAAGLRAAKVVSATPLPNAAHLRAVRLDLGATGTVETISAAPVIRVGSLVLYAPVGAKVSSFGTIREALVVGRSSQGMILPGEAVGMSLAAQEAVWLSDEFSPGDELPGDLFDDWIVEVDNKSITHRPDLWGHYGIAREIAAILGVPLKPYPVVPAESLRRAEHPTLPIHIADPQACRRYSGLVIGNVPTKPAPLWMQLRLGRVGLRPISALVDLTNYIMIDLGQPMHAFDAAKMQCIEVAPAREGERFRTLDGVERVLRSSDLMIQCSGQSVALAGVMGGANTEVSEATTELLLESANFDAAGIRRTASRLGLRTDASARFEKSLDPAHTELSIRRFVELAKPIWPTLSLRSSLSDAYPRPFDPLRVSVHTDRVGRMIGRPVTRDDVCRVLEPLGFKVTGSGTDLLADVPSFRATKDVSIEVDIVEEMARVLGFDTIVPEMPRVTVRRFPLNAMHEIERRSLEYFATVQRFFEIHGYIWYDGAWTQRLGFDPGACLELVNAAAENAHRLRRTLLPGLLAATARNRLNFPAFSIIEIGSTFEPHAGDDREYRHLGLISAQRARKADDAVLLGLKRALEGWAWERFSRTVSFVPTAADARAPWEDPQRTAAMVIDGRTIGRLGVVPITLRRTMDEHLAPWAIGWAEVRLEEALEITPRVARPGAIPPFPLVEVDVSIVVAKRIRFAEVSAQLASFQHPLLRGLRFLGHYEGEPLRPDQRSLTFRAIAGDDVRTLTDADVTGLREALETHVRHAGHEIRR